MAIMEHVREWQRRRAALAEVAGLDSHALNEMGVARGDLTRLAAMPAAQVDRMHQMAELHGLSADALDLSPEARDIALTCANCGATRTCRHALAQPDVIAEDCDFCPNTGVFTRLSQG
jgi:uncharacterized protein YjiS (DUF1127 family)